MKRYYVKDDDNEYIVEEMTDDASEMENTENEIGAEETKDEETVALTSDEITALKSIAAIADKLIGLVSEKPAEDEDIIETEDEETEEITDCGTTKPKDSKSGFGSIEKKQLVDDAIVDDIANAWAKRYNK